jgi:hypothetical protein
MTNILNTLSTMLSRTNTNKNDLVAGGCYPRRAELPKIKDIAQTEQEKVNQNRDCMPLGQTIKPAVKAYVREKTAYFFRAAPENIANAVLSIDPSHVTGQFTGSRVQE